MNESRHSPSSSLSEQEREREGHESIPKADIPLFTLATRSYWVIRIGHQDLHGSADHLVLLDVLSLGEAHEGEAPHSLKLHRLLICL